MSRPRPVCQIMPRAPVRRRTEAQTGFTNWGKPVRLNGSQAPANVGSARFRPFAGSQPTKAIAFA
jgi:hypothetical protein